jgi:HSP20 family protein
MLTTYRDPFKEMIDSFFDDRNYQSKNKKSSDVITTENEYRINLAVPGLSKEDIKIILKDDVLTVSYEKQETDDKTYSFVNSFKKSYRLPEDVDEKNIKGKVENGVVEITLPRSRRKSIERLISLN